MNYTLTMRNPKKSETSAEDKTKELLEQCHQHACELLRHNLTSFGVAAASVKADEDKRHYHCIFGRDAAIAALGMVVSEDPDLIKGACTGLRTLAEHQAANGQIPKYVDPSKKEGDFWYLGCIDATLWWLLALDFVTRHTGINLHAELSEHITQAIHWLQCQEHPRLFLLQQNEASDWADIMPRSGFVLYSNALWYEVKRRYKLAHLRDTRFHFNHLFHPIMRDIPEYRRLRLLMHYARKKVAVRDLYLSFVNFSFFGNEGDVFGNLLTVLFNIPGHIQSNQILRTLNQLNIDKPIPVRVTLRPISLQDPLWRSYMGRHKQNLENCYHNGGAWPFVGGFWVLALIILGYKNEAMLAMDALAKANKKNNWEFNEWFNGVDGNPHGMEGQTWNASMFLLAQYALSHKVF